jgi:hypothetical protein
MSELGEQHRGNVIGVVRGEANGKYIAREVRVVRRDNDVVESKKRP